jgi:hypothetical protein
MLCGGNIDTTTLGRCLERGLAADGRMATFKVVLEDRPGSIAGLTSLLSELKCRCDSLREIQDLNLLFNNTHIRASISSEYLDMAIICFSFSFLIHNWSFFITALPSFHPSSPSVLRISLMRERGFRQASTMLRLSVWWRL